MVHQDLVARHREDSPRAHRDMRNDEGHVAKTRSQQIDDLDRHLDETARRLEHDVDLVARQSVEDLGERYNVLTGGGAQGRLAPWC